MRNAVKVMSVCAMVAAMGASVCLAEAPVRAPLKIKLPDTVKHGNEANSLVVYVLNPRGPGGIYKPVWIAAGGKKPPAPKE